MRFVGMTFAVALGLLLFVNGLFMFMSPKKWFELPSFIRAQGTLTKQRYSSGFGAFQLRLTGLIMIATISWVVYDMFFSNR